MLLPGVVPDITLSRMLYHETPLATPASCKDLIDRLERSNLKANMDLHLNGSEATLPRVTKASIFEPRDDIETKLKLLTWPRPDLATFCIDVATLRENCPLDNSTGEKDSKVNGQADGAVPSPTPGWLDALPRELLQGILSSIDIASLTTLRAVNKCARLAIDHLPHYRAIFENVPDALRFMLSTGAAPYFTLTNLFDALLSLKCFTCGNFGSFLSVLDCKRYCYSCVEVPLTIDVDRVQNLFDQPSVFRLKAIRRLPGAYHKVGSTPITRKRTPFLPRSSVEHAIIAFKEAEGAKHTSIANTETAKSIGYLESLLRGEGDMSTRFGAVIPFPALHMPTKNWNGAGPARRVRKQK